MALRPRILPGRHPIEMQNYIIPTPALTQIKVQVENWIRRKVTGGMIYGAQRYGKTTSILYVIETLKLTVGATIPIFYIPMVSLENAVHGPFLKHFLKHTNHKLYSSGSNFDLKDRLNNHFIGMGSQSDTKTVVLFIDEAQLLLRLHMQMLVDLQNELRNKNVFGCFFLVGQPELRSMVYGYQISENMQIVGRLMSRQFEFKGLQNEQEIESCLKIFDEGAEYPENSGWSYTRYYAPEAYDSGWRLHRNAYELWNAFKEVREREKLPIKPDLPMEYFARTVECLLVEKIKKRSEFQGFTFNQIKEAILDSGYADGSRYLVKPNVKP